MQRIGNAGGVGKLLRPMRVTARMIPAIIAKERRGCEAFVTARTMGVFEFVSKMHGPSPQAFS